MVFVVMNVKSSGEISLKKGMKMKIEIDDTEMKSIIRDKLISRFKVSQRYFVASAVREVISDIFDKMDKKEFRDFLLCGLVEYLEKYSYKDIDKLIKEIRIKK